MDRTFNIKSKYILFIFLAIMNFIFAIIINIYQTNKFNVNADQPLGFCNVRLASNDYVNIQDYTNLANKAKDICNQYSEKISNLVEFNYHPSSIQFIVFSYNHDKNKAAEYGYNYSAYSLNKIIYINYDQYSIDSEFQINLSGVLIHEMTHNFQNYNNTNSFNSWITEGMATYVDKKILNHEPICNQDDNAKSGYGCSARFFYFIELKYNPNVVQQINKKMESGTYSDNDFYDYTKVSFNGSKTLTQLIAEFEQYKYSSLPTPTPVPSDIQPPTVPNITAKVQGQNNIILAWTASIDNVGVAGYEIYNADTGISINNTTGTTWTVTGAKCNASHNYYVKAYDMAGNKSSNSNIISIVSKPCLINDAQSPTKPIGIAAISTNCHDIKLTWIASTDNVGVAGYDIYNAIDNKIITTANTTSYSFNNLLSNTDYNYYIKAHDQTGNYSDKSDNITAKTIACTTSVPPYPIENISIKNNSTKTYSTSNIDDLVSTGSSLWFNILIAILLSAGLGYLLFRNEIWKKNSK